MQGTVAEETVVEGPVVERSGNAKIVEETFNKKLEVD